MSPSLMHRVVVESPHAGDIARHTAYLLMCLKDSLKRGEAPFASHALYTSVLDDADPHEREQGIDAGLAWATAADLVAVYTDLGVSPGMLVGIAMHQSRGLPIEYRTVPGWATP